MRKQVSTSLNSDILKMARVYCAENFIDFNKFLEDSIVAYLSNNEVNIQNAQHIVGRNDVNSES